MGVFSAQYRVGCLIGLLRRLQGWSHTSIFEEFARFAGTKAVDEEVSHGVFGMICIITST